MLEAVTGCCTPKSAQEELQDGVLLSCHGVKNYVQALVSLLVLGNVRCFALGVRGCSSILQRVRIAVAAL